MAGINRLGKAAPRPGSLRPADPHRNRTLDFFSETPEGALESDRDYQRTVQDIEDAQQTQGWLFSRGAFDKTDLLYLRDEEEKSRHVEMELHDKESMAYARLRKQVEQQKPAGPGLGIASRKIDKEKTRVQPRVMPRIVKVTKGAGLAPGQPAAAAASPTAAAEQSGDGSGLGALLGDYGSDSDDDDQSGAASPAEVAPPSAPQLPAAAPAARPAAAARVDARRSVSPAGGRGADAERHAEEELDFGT